MKELEKLLVEHKKLVAEKSSTQQMRDHAQKCIDEVLEERDFSSERNQRKVGEARTNLDMATGRLRALDRIIPKLKREIIAEFNSQRAAYRKLLKARREEVLDALTEKLRPHFGGDNRALRKQVESLARVTPELIDLSRAHFPESFNANRDPEDVAVDSAAEFCRHAARWTAKLNFTVPAAAAE